MEDIKAIIAENISALRRGSNMTQIELAEKLNYSDKAISKWERGESVPDVSVLKTIADLFGVTVDYLITRDHEAAELNDMVSEGDPKKRKVRAHGMITGMSVLLVWLVATIVFALIDAAQIDAKWHWLSFIYAILASTIVWLVFNAVWFNRRRNYFIISLLMWSAILAIHLSLLPFGINLWQVYLAGIPGQLIIILWSIIGKKN